MCVSPDGRRLVARTQPGKLVLWDIAAQKEQAILAQSSRCTVLDFSPDGARLAVGEANAIRFREGEKLKESEALTGHPDTVTAIAFYRRAARNWQSAASTDPCGCGTWRHESTRT